MYYVSESGNEKRYPKQFTLGQSSGYYRKIKALGDVTRKEILTAQNDIAYSPELYEKVLSERVTQDSLLRDIKKAIVKGQDE